MPAFVRRPAPPRLPADLALPELVCEELAAPKLVSVSVAPGESLPKNTGFGLRRLPELEHSRNHGHTLAWTEQYGSDATGVAEHALLAVSHGRVPAVLVASEGRPAHPAGIGATFAVDFRQPFDSAAWVRVAHVPWRSVAVAAQLLDVALHLGDEENAEYDVPGQALPVGTADGRDGGLLLTDETLPFWVRPRGAALAASFGPGVYDFVPVSAFAQSPDRLLVLGVDERGRERVVMTGSTQRTLFELPLLPTGALGVSLDAVALGPGGEVAVLHASTASEPPSESDPALLVRPGAPPQPLPSWSTLRAGGAAECADASGDHRALLLRPHAWVRLRAADAPRQADMVALVRVDAKRWCLDAIEVLSAEVRVNEWLSIPTAVVARFGAKPVAARVGVARGGEFRQEVSCELRPR